MASPIRMGFFEVVSFKLHFDMAELRKPYIQKGTVLLLAKVSSINT